MSGPRLVIRADANVAMGTGHVMRCLALAQAWQDAGGGCVFAMEQSTSAVESRLREQGMEVAVLRAAAGSVEDARETAGIAAEQGARWIVVDGYQFGSEYQSAIRAAGFKFLFLDDYVHAAPYSADLILNQNFQAKAEMYSQRDSCTQLLLGPRYAMLRREFRAWRDWRRENHGVAKKILVTMGGSDPDNATSIAMEAVRSIRDLGLETTVLVGGSNPHLQSIRESIASEDSAVRLVVDAGNVAEWMVWADVAISGAGTTVWELCFLGLPSVLLVLADNQEPVAEFAEKMQIAWNLGRPCLGSSAIIAEKVRELLNSRDVRAMQSRNGRSLVDGRGAERVVAHLSDLQLRPTTSADCELFWEWANDAQARAASFRNKTISWEHHANWFESKMQDANAVLYTATRQDACGPIATKPNSAECAGTPVGQVRFQIEGQRAVLSISLGCAYRGRGWGKEILKLAVGKFFQEYEADFIDAFVKPANVASLKLFENAGFERVAPAVVEGQEAVHFVMGKIQWAEICR